MHPTGDATRGVVTSTAAHPAGGTAGARGSVCRSAGDSAGGAGGSSPGKGDLVANAAGDAACGAPMNDSDNLLFKTFKGHKNIV